MLLDICSLSSGLFASCGLSPSLSLFAPSIHYISHSRVAEDYPKKDRSRAASDYTISSWFCRPEISLVVCSSRILMTQVHLLSL